MQANNIKLPVFQFADVSPGFVEKIACNDDYQFYQNINKILCNKLTEPYQKNDIKFAECFSNDCITNSNENENGKTAIFIELLRSDIEEKSMQSGIPYESVGSIELQYPESSEIGKVPTNQFKGIIDPDISNEYYPCIKPTSNFFDEMSIENSDTNGICVSYGMKELDICGYPSLILDVCEPSVSDFTIFAVDPLKSDDTLAPITSFNQSAIIIEKISAPLNKNCPTVFLRNEWNLPIKNKYLIDFFLSSWDEKSSAMSPEFDICNLGNAFDYNKNPNNSIANDFMISSPANMDSSGQELSLSTSIPQEVIVDSGNFYCINSLLPFLNVKETSIAVPFVKSINKGDITSPIDIKKQREAVLDILSVRWTNPFVNFKADKKDALIINDYHENTFSGVAQPGQKIIPTRVKSFLRHVQNLLSFSLVQVKGRISSQVFMDSSDQELSVSPSIPQEITIDNGCFNYINFLPPFLKATDTDIAVSFDSSIANGDITFPVDIKRQEGTGVDDISVIKTSPVENFKADKKGTFIIDDYHDNADTGVTQLVQAIIATGEKWQPQPVQNLFSFDFDQVNIGDGTVRIGTLSFSGIENNASYGINNVEISRKFFSEQEEQILFYDFSSISPDDSDHQSAASSILKLNKNILYALNEKLNDKKASVSFFDINEKFEIAGTHLSSWENSVNLTHSTGRSDCFVDFVYADELYPVFLSSPGSALIKQPFLNKANNLSEQGIVDSINTAVDSIVSNSGSQVNVDIFRDVIQSEKKNNDTTAIDGEDLKNFLTLAEQDQAFNYDDVQISKQKFFESQSVKSQHKDDIASFDIGSKFDSAIPVMAKSNVQNNFDMYLEVPGYLSEKIDPVLFEPDKTVLSKCSTHHEVDSNLCSELTNFDTLGSRNGKSTNSRWITQKIGLNKRTSLSDYSKFFRFETFGETRFGDKNASFSEKANIPQVDSTDDAKYLNFIKNSVATILIEDWGAVKSAPEDPKIIEINDRLGLIDPDENLSIDNDIKLKHLLAKSSEQRQELIEKFVIDQVISKSRIEINKGNAEIKIEIKPKILGNIKIHILKENHQIIANVTADSSYVKELIQNQIHLLRNELHEQRIDVREINIFLNKENGYFNSQSNNQSETEKRPFNPFFFDPQPDDDRKDDNNRPAIPEEHADEKNIDYYA